MQKETKGYLVLYNNHSNKRVDEDEIKECSIDKVGRKYITVERKQFYFSEGLNAWVEKTQYSPEWLLFLSKQEAEHYVWRRKTIRLLRRPDWSSVLMQMDDDELKTILNIYRKHFPEL